MNAEAVRAWLSAHYDAEETAYQHHRENDRAVGFSHGRTYDRGLREVAAKRRRLERHAPCDAGTAGHPWCEWCTSNDEYEGWPCPDIIDDAQSFADRPDFPAELRLP